jgi:SEC-C motif-containing protein
MSSDAENRTPAPCPCGAPLPLHQCCGRVHAGTAPAATAEALMRSRYSAFALGDRAYLLRSWHPTTRPTDLTLDPGQRWTHLEILSTTGGGLLHADGTVEFRAHYRTADGRPGSMHETSRFVRENGHWVYVDGVQT